MNFDTNINIIHEQYNYANFVSCDLDLEPGIYGQRITITFHIAPTTASAKDNALKQPVLERIDGELFLCEAPDRRTLIGRLLTLARQWPVSLSGGRTQFQMTLDLSSQELLLWADRTRHGNMVLEVELVARLLGVDFPRSVEKSRFTVPQSRWLALLEKSRLCRFEYISLRTPVRTSASFPVYDECFNMLLQAQLNYDRGDFNAVGGKCRSGLRHLLNWASPRSGSDAFDKLLANVIGDVRRNKFARTLVKGLNDVLNEGTHLEGTAGQPTTDLRREDALLCLHWYAAIIGYIADVEQGRTIGGT